MVEQLKELYANKLNFKHQQRFVVIDLGEPDGTIKAITLHCGHKKLYTTDVVEADSATKEKKGALIKGEFGTYRFECTADQFKQMQLQLNSDAEYIYYPDGAIKREQVSILKWA